MSDHQLTLATLLSIKTRRERGVRSAMARLEQQRVQLEQHKAALLQARRQLWHQWRQCGSNEQVLGPVEWRSYRLQLANYYQQDHDLLAQVEATGDEFMRLQVAIEEQQDLLRQILLEQEKLKILLE
jgi:hypothetical protein